MAKKKEPPKKEPLAIVMTRLGAMATFRRNIRNDKGEIVKKLQFPPGTPVELHTKAEVEAVYGDIGKALVIVRMSDLGQAHPDFDATDEVVRERDGEDIAEQLVDESSEGGDGKASEDDSKETADATN
ncbi:MAG: hypothetical protein AAFX06_21800 [Planctomycetota bacterium]